MPYKRNLLIINVVGGGKPFLKGIFVNTLILVLISVSLLSSCEHVSEEELRQALEECGDTVLVVDDGWEDTIKVNFSKEQREIRGPDGS